MPDTENTDALPETPEAPEAPEAETEAPETETEETQQCRMPSREALVRAGVRCATLARGRRINGKPARPDDFRVVIEDELKKHL